MSCVLYRWCEEGQVFADVTDGSLLCWLLLDPLLRVYPPPLPPLPEPLLPLLEREIFSIFNSVY
jgi:hypothetical protein